VIALKLIAVVALMTVDVVFSTAAVKCQPAPPIVGALVEAVE